MKQFTLLVLAVVAVALAGCNTMEGFGKDIKKAGEKIEQKASR